MALPLLCFEFPNESLKAGAGIQFNLPPGKLIKMSYRLSLLEKSINFDFKSIDDVKTAQELIT